MCPLIKLVLTSIKVSHGTLILPTTGFVQKREKVVTKVNSEN